MLQGPPIQLDCFQGEPPAVKQGLRRESEDILAYDKSWQHKVGPLEKLVRRPCEGSSVVAVPRCGQDNRAVTTQLLGGILQSVAVPRDCLKHHLAVPTQAQRCVRQLEGSLTDRGQDDFLVVPRLLVQVTQRQDAVAHILEQRCPGLVHAHEGDVGERLPAVAPQRLGILQQPVARDQPLLLQRRAFFGLDRGLQVPHSPLPRRRDVAQGPAADGPSHADDHGPRHLSPSGCFLLLHRPSGRRRKAANCRWCSCSCCCSGCRSMLRQAVHLQFRPSSGNLHNCVRISRLPLRCGGCLGQFAGGRTCGQVVRCQCLQANILLLKL
mmetsp:Transcript_137718/g.439967  ORF Transcript_137718/g.439967 Transcript_137718/m.439967 type:complete len:324 (-) Transcript_137718:286-1257(-)